MGARQVVLVCFVYIELNFGVLVKFYAFYGLLRSFESGAARRAARLMVGGTQRESVRGRRGGALGGSGRAKTARQSPLRPWLN